MGAVTWPSVRGELYSPERKSKLQNWDAHFIYFWLLPPLVPGYRVPEKKKEVTDRWKRLGDYQKETIWWKEDEDSWEFPVCENWLESGVDLVRGRKCGLIRRMRSGSRRTFFGMLRLMAWPNQNLAYPDTGCPALSRQWAEWTEESQVRPSALKLCG